MLVAEYRAHNDELRADLQQTYGIDLDRAMAGEHTAAHIAALVAQLPPDARVRVASDKDAVWTLSDIINVSVFNSVRALMWGLGDPKRRGREPELVGPSWLKAANRHTLPARALPVDELLKELNKPRR